MAARRQEEGERMRNVRTVRLRRFWNRPWEGATCGAEALCDLRWANHRTLGENSWWGPKMLTALVSCADVADVDTIHLASHGDCPHMIRVVIAGVDNRTRVYRELRARARGSRGGPMHGRRHDRRGRRYALAPVRRRRRGSRF